MPNSNTENSTTSSREEIQIEQRNFQEQEVAVESNASQRSSSFRNLFLPCLLTMSANCFALTIINEIGRVRYGGIRSPEELSPNATSTDALQYNHQQYQDGIRYYQNTMIPIATVSFGALAIQQILSYFRRNSTIGERRRIIEQQQVSAEFVYQVPDRNLPSNENMAEAIASQGSERPSAVASLVEGEGLISSSRIQVGATRYSV